MKEIMKINKYTIVNDWENGKINSNKSHEGLFPRMWSSDNAVNYLNYYGFLDFEIKILASEYFAPLFTAESIAISRYSNM